MRGWLARSIAHRVETGRLIRLHRGVYAVGHRPPSLHARMMAAVLACGPRRRAERILVHRSRTLTRADVTRHHGIPAPFFEDSFLAFVDRHGLPRPEVDQLVAGYGVDMRTRSRRTATATPR